MTSIPSTKPHPNNETQLDHHSHRSEQLLCVHQQSLSELQALATSVPQQSYRVAEATIESQKHQQVNGETKFAGASLGGTRNATLQHPLAQLRRL
jgi:hypothetical protein